MPPERPKVLYYAPNHQAACAGGSEIYAYELFAAMRQREDWEAYLLTGSGSPRSPAAPCHGGTALSLAEAGESQRYLFHHETADYDYFRGARPNKQHLTLHLDRFLRDLEPAVVHFHQPFPLGYDALRQVRNTLPGAALVWTLHEFGAICHRDGQLLRRSDNTRCNKASPQRCHECFPDIAPREFFLRRRFIQAQLDHVDLFLAPSRFLLERYADWGLPRHKLVYEPYGRASIPSGPSDHAPRVARGRFGFFGQLSHYKGLPLLLRAMKSLEQLQPGAARLWVHGNKLELQPAEIQQQIHWLREDLGPLVHFSGSYARHDIRQLMANIDWVVVPSIWWENLPLVIQEAFLCGRPVICGDAGGMAELVTPEVHGLHFRTGDATSLAETMLRAATTTGLWEKLAAHLPTVLSIEDQAEKFCSLYRHLREARHAMV